MVSSVGRRRVNASREDICKSRAIIGSSDCMKKRKSIGKEKVENMMRRKKMRGESTTRE
jgi:hypothetical protein